MYITCNIRILQYNKFNKMGFFDIIVELDEIDKILPTAGGAAIGVCWGIIRMIDYKFGDMANPPATDVLAVTVTGILMGAPIGALSGYFWYASVPALAIYCVFCIDKAA